MASGLSAFVPQNSNSENDGSNSNVSNNNRSNNNRSNNNRSNNNRTLRVPYKKRKQQLFANNDDLEQWSKYEGIDYSTREPLITQLFDTDQLPQELHTKYGVEQVTRSYIYIISKKVDGRTFFKIGMSNLGNTKQKVSTRLESAQTFLIPGFENAGFKLHYVFFYRREAQQSGTSYGELIERALHKYLKIKYEQAVIYMPSKHRSEWYLPEIDQYETFIDEVLKFISVQTPEPEEAYYFTTTKRGALKRQYSDQFMPKTTRSDIIEHRHDYVEQKKSQYAQVQKNKQHISLRRGNKKYFMEKLVVAAARGGRPPPLGRDLEIVDIYYHKTKTDELRKFGEYYAQIKNTRAGHENNLPTGIIVSFEETTTKKFFSHISHVLDYMKQAGTLEDYSMVNNYNYYYDLPIKKAKLYLKRGMNVNYQYTPSQCKWLLGRVVRDKEDNLFRAVEITETRGKKVDKIIYHELQKTNLKYKEPRVVKKADPNIAIQLAVDYHENRLHVGIKHKIDNSLDGRGDVGMGAPPPRSGGNSAYDVFDFVKFKPNYFRVNGQPDPKEYLGVILQKKWNYVKNNDTGEMEYEYQYEILFDNDELWQFSVGQVDDKKVAVKLSTVGQNSKRQIKTFLDGRRLKKNVIYRLYEKYGIQRPDLQQGSLMLPNAPVIVRPRRSTGRQNTRRQGTSPTQRRTRSKRPNSASVASRTRSARPL
jgi:hypothetical protein